MSFLKYQDDPRVVQGDGRGSLSFARAHLDGMPFRGNAPMLKEDEYQAVCDTVYDTHVRVFDLGNQDEAEDYRKILDRVTNGWYRLLHMRPVGESLKYVLMWAEPFKEVNRNKLPSNTIIR